MSLAIFGKGRTLISRIEHWSALAFISYASGIGTAQAVQRPDYDLGGDTDTDVAGIVENVANSVKEVPNLFLILFFVIGLFVGLWGFIILYRAHQEVQRAQDSKAKGWIMLLIGALACSGTAVMTALRNSVLGTN